MMLARLTITAVVAAVTVVCSLPGATSEFAMEMQRHLSSAGKLALAEDAAGAVDGKFTGRYSFHTGEDNPPWWQVDPGSVQSIGLVRIHTPHYSERLTKFQLLASDDGASWKTLHEHGALTNQTRRVEVRFRDVRTRYVRIAASGRTWMHLDEVEVFSPDDERTNLALHRPCNQSSISIWSSRSVSLSAQEDWRTAFDTGQQVIHSMLKHIPGGDELAASCDALIGEKVSLDDPRWNRLYRAALDLSTKWMEVRRQFDLVDLAALARALDDLSVRHP